MDSHEALQELEQWIQGRLILLDPPAGWEPNARVARARFEARPRRRRRRIRFWLAAATATVLVCIALGTIRPSRAFAQKTGGGTADPLYRVRQLWDWAAYVRSGPVLLPRLAADLKLVEAQPLADPGAPQVVPSVEDAAKVSGFVPLLPHTDVLLNPPRLSVFGPTISRTTVSTVDLKRLLTQADVSDQSAPVSWDGAQITLQIGATVTAEWNNFPDEWSGEIEWSKLTLTQGPMPVIAAPAGFDLAAFTEANLRAAGMRNRKVALQLSGLQTTAPALLLARQTQRHIAVLLVNLYSFSLVYTRLATLIEEFETREGADYDHGGPPVERMTLVWSAPDRGPNRMYVLTGTLRNPSDMFSLDFAGALTNLMDLATSIY